MRRIAGSVCRRLFDFGFDDFHEGGFVIILILFRFPGRGHGADQGFGQIEFFAVAGGLIRRFEKGRVDQFMSEVHEFQDEEFSLGPDGCEMLF